MEIVIKIPDELYNNIIDIPESSMFSIDCDSRIRKAIQNGTPLPKGHGDLVDRSKIYKAIPAEEDNCTGMGMTLEEMDAYNEGIDAMYSIVKGASKIIAADTAESEDKE